MLAALQPQLGVVEQRLPPADSAACSSSNTTRPLRSGGLKANSRPAPSVGSRVQPLDLGELLGARLGLAGAGARAKAGHEPLQALDLGLLALDRAAEGQLAGRLLPPPGVPGAGEEPAAPGLQLEHGGADRLQEPAIVGDEHDRRVEADQMPLQPLQRRDVEMVGRLVEQQQVGVAGQRAAERGAGQLAAGERGQRRGPGRRRRESPRPCSVASARSRQL